MSTRSKLVKTFKQACEHAQNYSFEYSCCINKESSAELSEALNSMYQYYEDAEVCYVYLSDVSGKEDPRDPSSAFRVSRWFKRAAHLSYVSEIRVFVCSVSALLVFSRSDGRHEAELPEGIKSVIPSGDSSSEQTLLRQIYDWMNAKKYKIAVTSVRLSSSLALIFMDDSATVRASSPGPCSS
ncbi:hypothetical protein K435DRAFT_857909 [Dendrothele bispora CBS 962.96]|uniref:Heterokaryon incompatibility domain-containing protein n=1 Tax=Dendrothele bispora (strain CBS 962.96) TaxID=1314807 RepID=A0A4V6T5G2_DENBC|nr:hypothetical protein K435DRAFT_857909 [Dendrothele bispora CBS 962.96]